VSIALPRPGSPGRLAVTAARLDAAWASFGRDRTRAGAPPTPDIRWVPLGGTLVRARVIGSGPAPPIVLIPDPPNTIEHYGPLIDRLTSAPGAERRAVVCFDAPGFGFSFPERGFSYSMDEQVRLIASLFDTLGLASATLSVGCLGGFFGVLLAKARPDLVRRLVLVQMPSCGEALRWVRGGYWWLFGTPFLGQATMALAKGRVARMWYGACLGPGARVEDYAGPALDAIERGGSFCLASAFQMFRPDLADLSGVRQDALVIWGGADRTHPSTDRRSVLTHLPRARWEEWPECGHYPDVEAPEAYARCLRG
jgi:pimeloyl-ACP methyl ester carboxylesterase